MSYTVEQPIQYTPDPSKFGTLAGGKVWFGVPNGNPASSPSDRIQVYLARQNLSDLPIAQPIDIGPGGAWMYNGSPAQIKVLVPYCVQITNSLGVQKFYSPDAGDKIAKFNALDAEQGIQNDAIAKRPIVVQRYADIATAVAAASIGQQLSLVGHTVAGIGGGMFDVVSSTGLTGNNGTIVINGSKAAVRVSKGYLTAGDFGAAVDGVTDDSLALSRANTQALAGNVELLIDGVIHVGSATTITAPLVDSTERLFSSTSQITINNGQPIRPEWWGTGANTLLKAIAALPSTGGEIVMLPRDYNIVGSYYSVAFTGPYVGNVKPGVKLRGAGMPRVSADGSRFISGSGTVIQGSLINYADGFEAYDFGVDVGTYVNATYDFGGHYPEGFVPGMHRFQGTPGDLTTYIKDVAFGNIKVLAVNNLNHAILCEFINGLSHGYCEAIGGYHGYVCKSTNVVGGDVWAYGQVGDGYIIKSDEYTRAQNIQINSITLGKRGYATRTAQGFLQSTTGGHVTSRVSIGAIHGWNCKELITKIGDNEPITDISVGIITGDDIQGNGISILGNMRRIQIGKHIISNTTVNGVYVDSGSGETIDIGDGVVTNAGTNGYHLIGFNHTHGDIRSINATAWGFNRVNSFLDMNRIGGSGNASGLVTSAYELLNSSNLLNSWVNETGSWPFQVVLTGRTLHFRGTVKSGTNGVIAQIPAGYRPSVTLSFATAAITAGVVRAFAHVDIDSTGNITVANFAGVAPGLGGTGCVVSLNFSYLL